MKDVILIILEISVSFFFHILVLAVACAGVVYIYHQGGWDLLGLSFLLLMWLLLCVGLILKK